MKVVRYHQLLAKVTDQLMQQLRSRHGSDTALRAGAVGDTLELTSQHRHLYRLVRSHVITQRGHMS
jgi:hypothetical protein